MFFPSFAFICIRVVAIHKNKQKKVRFQKCSVNQHFEMASEKKKKSPK